MILARLIEKAQPGTIDSRALNTKQPLNIFHVKENLNVVISSARSIGCKIISIYAEQIMEKKGYLILAILWQVLRMVLLSHISLKENPYLVRLLEEGEDIEHFKSQPPEEILKRWFNWHLKNANHDRKVTNFDKDVADAVNYTVLLNQLNQDKCDLSGLGDNENTRAKKAIDNAEKLGVEKMIKEKDITSGNNKLNLLFTAEIYNACHGLEPKTEAEQKEQFEKAKLMEEKGDPNDTREERSFRIWANGLDTTDMTNNPYYYNNLYEDVSDAIQLLKIMEKVGKPGLVDWKKVAHPATNNFKVLQNCNYAVEVGKNLGLTVVNIGGSDIHNKNKKLILGLFWQMVRMHTLQTIGGINEDELLKWANAKAKGIFDPIKSFSDQNIRNCKFLFALCNGIDERVVDWEFVKKGDNEEEVELNCKYVISVARRLGATVMCIWEDIKEVKPKMILTFIANLKKVADDPNLAGKK